MNNPSMAPPTSNQLRGRTLLLARFAWALVLLAVMVAFLAALPYRIQDLRQDPYGLGVQLAKSGLSIDHFVAYAMAWEFLVILASLIMAAVIYWRKSDERMGLLLSISLILMLAILPVIPALGIAIPILLGPLLVLRLIAFFCFILVCFLFPDGRFVPKWAWSWFIFYLLVTPFLAFTLNAGNVAAPIDIQSPKDAFAILWMLLGMSGGVLAQFYRFRHVSSPIQRQQTKWVMYGFAALFLGLIVIALPVFLFSDIKHLAEVRLAYLLITIPVTLLGYFAVPFSLGVSILRYRLWDIDLIIRRTLAYGALTVTLAAVYFAGVVFLQQVFLRLSGDESAVAIVISTLAIAALFNPLRRRIQMDIDRQFFRSRYDAEKALANFNSAARDEVEMKVITAKLVSVVEETMQPEHISLWLKDPGEGFLAGKN